MKRRLLGAAIIAALLLLALLGLILSRYLRKGEAHIERLPRMNRKRPSSILVGGIPVISGHRESSPAHRISHDE
jgi:hypothetical protein